VSVTMILNYFVPWILDGVGFWNLDISKYPNFRKYLQ
jgi:hypothetical protein